MSQERSLLNSILTVKCPRCRQGNMFPSGTLYSTKFDQMHPACPCCGQDFEPEPGFYYGAMYVSFATGTAAFIMVLIALNFLVAEITMAMVMTSVVIISVGLLPINFRFSRVAWLNIFVHYKGPVDRISGDFKTGSQ